MNVARRTKNGAGSLVRTLLLWTATVLVVPGVQAQDELHINHRWLNDRVLLTWACDHFQGTNMAVIATGEGLVVIDTGLSPTTVARQRRLVEHELGRDDFRYVINTHMHNDHVFANQVFPRATVVGPESSVAALQREVSQIPGLVARLRENGASYREWAAEAAPEGIEGIHAREGLASFSIGIADLERGIEPRPPTVTFDDRHTLDLGGLRIELFQFQGLHSDSDVLVLLPQLKVLFTGDVFWGGQLPVLRSESPGELERLLDHWREILEMVPDLEVVVPGHSDVPLEVDQLRSMYAYLSRLREDVRRAKEAGITLLRFVTRNDRAERYPEVADLNWVRRDYSLHQHNIYVMWSLTAGDGHEPSGSDPG